MDTMMLIATNRIKVTATPYGSSGTLAPSAGCSGKFQGGSLSLLTAGYLGKLFPPGSWREAFTKSSVPGVVSARH